MDFTEEQITAINEQYVNPAVETAKSEAVNFESASKYLKGKDAKVFLNQSAFEKSISENPPESVLASARGLAFGTIDQKIFSLTGIGKLKDENGKDEKTKDYLERAFPIKNSENGNDSKEIEALKKVIEQKGISFTELETKFSDLQSKGFKDGISNEINGVINKLPLDYEGFDLENTTNGIKSKINDSYEFKTDEKGLFVVNKSNGETVLDSDGNRKPISKVVSDFIGQISDIKLKSTSSQQYEPNTNGELSGEALQGAEAKAKAEIEANGLYGNEKEAILIKQKHGLPISEQEKKLV